MQEVGTLVYFDLEATGLKNSGKPRICEISLLAVNIQDVLDLSVTIMDHFKSRNNEDSIFHAERLLPRIVNKLTLCVYPMATIVPLVSDMTGLDNYNLIGQSKFNKNTGDLINSFLSCLPSPVCLVAHNGNAYDFPLLKAEMEKAGTQLNSDILCADSYLGIKEIFDKRGDIRAYHTKDNVEQTEDTHIVKMEMDAVTDLMKAGMFETEMVEGQCDRLGNETSSTSIVSKEENELTPCGNKNTVASSLNPSKLKKISCPKKSKSSKKLFFSNPRAPTSFSLINLHKHFLGFPPDQSHGAEADCLTLLRTTAVLGSDWIDWVKSNCYLFANCKKMWGLTGQAA
jgi:three prime repair exonuclease-1